MLNYEYFFLRRETHFQQQLHNTTSFSLLRTRAAGAMSHRQTQPRVRDVRVSVLYILAHTVFLRYCFKISEMASVLLN